LAKENQKLHELSHFYTERDSKIERKEKGSEFLEKVKDN